MTQKNEELLLKDLCARLLYEVKVLYEGQIKEIQYIEPLYNEVKLSDTNYTVSIYEVKPYLRPMSSMTEEEIHKFEEILGPDIETGYGFVEILDSSVHTFTFLELQALFDWLNKNHFDYRGLIEKGLALEAPEDMYN